MKITETILDYIPEYEIRSICPLEEMLLFDIETTGLRKETTQIYLIGCACYRENAWRIRQWLTENTSDERLVLEDFADYISGFHMAVTFNGDGFDIPYLQFKADLYGMPDLFSGMDTLDLYKKSKSARALLGLKSMSQKSVEQFLGIDREDQLNGGLLIPVYYRYEKSGETEEERLLLLHNYDDIQGMLRILPILSYGDLFDGKFTFTGLQLCPEGVRFRYQLEHRVPVTCSSRTYGTGKRKPSGDSEAESRTEGDILVTVRDETLEITYPVFEDEGRMPLENVSDYYYLVEEDRVIHKDVAQFAGRSRRVRATRQNCFIKKDGRFLPQVCNGFSPRFRLADDAQRDYADLNSLTDHPDPDRMRAEALAVLKSIRS